MAKRTASSLEPALVSPKEAAQLQAHGAVFVDVRETYEFNARRIDGSRSAPMSNLPETLGDMTGGVIFYCQTGVRTVEGAERLKAIAPAGSVQLAGGLDAWLEAGFPVTGGDTANLVGADLLKRLLSSIGKANQ